VREALEHEPLVPAGHVQVARVSAGWLTLEGEVDYLSQKFDAELAARSVEDVAGVINAISVKPGTFESVEPEV
jgi:osmotically-inducible protein OsmY